MEEYKVVQMLEALAHAKRLKVFRALVQTGAAGTTPTALAKQLAMPPSTLSFHLKELVNAGLITSSQQGRTITYCAAYRHMNLLIAYLTENCCGGANC